MGKFTNMKWLILILLCFLDFWNPVIGQNSKATPDDVRTNADEKTSSSLIVPEDSMEMERKRRSPQVDLVDEGAADFGDPLCSKEEIRKKRSLRFKRCGSMTKRRYKKKGYGSFDTCEEREKLAWNYDQFGTAEERGRTLCEEREDSPIAYNYDQFGPYSSEEPDWTFAPVEPRRRPGISREMSSMV